jgi:hypothetical protein
LNPRASSSSALLLDLYLQLLSFLLKIIRRKEIVMTLSIFSKEMRVECPGIECLKVMSKAWPWWLTSVIPATQEAEIRRITV